MPPAPASPRFEPPQASAEAEPRALAERELVGRLRRGERPAAVEFVERHLEALYEFVHWRLGRERALTEDVVQDTFVVALEGITRFDGRSSLAAWLNGIARNKIREQRRALAARPRLALDELLEESDAEIDRILADLEREPLPEWVLERRETQQLVGAALSSLPEDYRSALIAKYVDGQSVAEIAQQHGRSPKAAESLLTRSRLAFQRVLELLARRSGGVR